MKAVFHEDFLQQTQGYGHPECPERLSAIISYLENRDICRDFIKPEPADIHLVREVHTPGYLDYLENLGMGRIDPDTAWFPHTYEMALLSAGGGLAAVENMLDHNEPTFALLRPPGHHAESGMAKGFCYLNNIGIAADWLSKRLDKIAIVDIDVHHGNGTNKSFSDRDDILFISAHQWGIFPGTGPAEDIGTGKGTGFNVNIPLNARSGDATYEAAVGKMVVPILKQYQPDAILFSLGIDAHYMDPLASINLSSPGYIDMFRKITDFAAEACDDRYSVFLEGGYNLGALAEVVGGTMAHSIGQDMELRYTEVSDQENVGSEFLKKAVAIQSKYWDL